MHACVRACVHACVRVLYTVVFVKVTLHTKYKLLLLHFCIRLDNCDTRYLWILYWLLTLPQQPLILL